MTGAPPLGPADVDSRAARLWRCVEIVGGVAVGLALTAIPFPGE